MQEQLESHATTKESSGLWGSEEREEGRLGHEATEAQKPPLAVAAADRLTCMALASLEKGGQLP